MSPGEVRSWEPKEPEVLRGVLCLLESRAWAVRTDDGTIWSLGAAAEEQLRSLEPAEGQEVQVMYIRDGLGPRVHVSVH